MALVPPWFPPLLAVPPNTDPSAHLLQCLEAFQRRAPLWLRTRTGQCQAVLAAFEQQDIAACQDPRLPQALRIDGRTRFAVDDHAWRGLVEIQDLASQAVGFACAPAPGTAWWDACAGAGGKTLHLADLMNNRGFLLATDLRASAIAELQRRMADSGASVIRAQTWDGQTPPAPGREFDGILVDAPCSCTGTWPRNPDARWRMTESTVLGLAATQLRLLQTCASRLRPGGILVYSTCTLTRAENSDVIHHFLESRPDLRLDPFPNPLDGQPTDGLLPLWPWTGPCNGMFIARLRRITGGT